MNIAVFSDIHGNHIAFQKCYEYALKKNIDTLIFLGDYLGEFPYPQKTMEVLYSIREKHRCYFVRGNKEDYWINHKNSGMEWKEGTSSTGALQYCYSNLKDEDIDFFSRLPISAEIEFEGYEPLLACHGSPIKNNQKMLPDNNTKSVLKNCSQKYILCGHTHIQQVISHNEKVVLNPGAVGVSLHGAGKAQFMILQSRGTEWGYEFVALDYDKELAIKEMQESGLVKFAPYWTRITIHLILTGEISHGTVLAKAMEYCMEETGDCKWYDVPEKYWKRAVDELLAE